MSKKSFIDSVEVGTPCSKDWNDMHGTDKIRLCSHCSKHVSNLSAMTRKEAARFVLESDRNICIRYIADPVTKRPMFAEQLFQIARRAPGLAAGVITASIALSSQSSAQNNNKPRQTPPTVVETNNDYTQRPVISRELLDLPQNLPPRTLLGPIRVESKRREELVFTGDMAAIDYFNPINGAVALNDIAKVRDLIAKGGKVNGKDGNYGLITPLFVAVENGRVEMVAMLLKAGAKVNARDTKQQTPLMRLDRDATADVVKMLVRHGAKINLTDNDGNTAIILAANDAKSEVLQALVDAGADVRLGDKNGQTALMNAAANGHLGSARVLIQAGSDVNAKNKLGETALDHAANDEIKELLIRSGAKATAFRPE